MQLTFNWIDKLKRYTHFSPKELRAMIISIMVIAFAISFDKWGPGNTVEVTTGLINLLSAILIVAVTFFSRMIFQKAIALGADYQAEYKMWSFGLLATLIIAFVSSSLFGKSLWFIIPGGIVVHYMAGHRLGWVRYGLNTFGIGVISLAGPIFNIILAMVFRMLYSVTALDIFQMAYILNIWWAIWTMIPIPPADGGRMFFGSRLVYMFGLGVVISSAILLYSNFSVLIIIPAAVIVAAIWWLIYYIIWERFNWKGP